MADICKMCGYTLKEFKESALLGCSQCYKYLNVDEVVRNNQGVDVHNGKYPEKWRRYISVKQKLDETILSGNYEEITKLDNQLKIAEEEIYE